MKCVIFLAILANVKSLILVEPKAASLPQLNIDKNAVTVSGLSSGGFMAVQLHVAYSATFKGVGVHAGGPYDCAQGNMMNALGRCMTHFGGIPVSSLVSDTKKFAQQNKIDPVSNLADSKVYLFSGSRDTTVNPGVINDCKTYYSSFVQQRAPLAPSSGGEIFYRNDVAAEHAIVTDKYGNACTAKASPYINNCHFDAAGEMFKVLYGDLKSRSNSLASQFLKFDQNEHFGGQRTAMASTGWVFIPKKCQEGATCRLHVALHGCQQNEAAVGDVFVRHAGYNEWADANEIVVLYPQTGVGATNGCWDWWGYLNDYYAIKKGPQMASIKRMVDRLTSGSRVVTTVKPSPGPTFNPTEGTTKVTEDDTEAPTSELPVTTDAPTERPLEEFTANNYAHVAAGRAYLSLGYAHAKGSGDLMGLYNIFTITTLIKTGDNYFVLKK